MNKFIKKILLILIMICSLTLAIVPVSADGPMLGMVQLPTDYSPYFNSINPFVVIDGAISEVSYSFDPEDPTATEMTKTKLQDLLIAYAPPFNGGYLDYSGTSIFEQYYSADDTPTNTISLRDDQAWGVFYDNFNINVGGSEQYITDASAMCIAQNFYVDNTFNNGTFLEYLIRRSGYGDAMHYRVQIEFSLAGQVETYRCSTIYNGSSVSLNINDLVLKSDLDIEAFKDPTLSDDVWQQQVANYDPFDHAAVDQAIVFGSMPSDIYVHQIAIKSCDENGDEDLISNVDVNNLWSGQIIISSAYFDREKLGAFREDELILAGADQYAEVESFTKWIGHAVAGFFNLEIMPNFRLGNLLVVIVTFSVVLWWLKVFAGG